MTYLLWPQDQDEHLLDLSDITNFKLFLKQFVPIVKTKQLVITEEFYQILNKHLSVEVVSKFNIRYILANDLSFILPHTTTCNKAESIIAQFDKYVDEDLYVIGDKNTIRSFFSKTDYLIVFTFNCLNSKIIKKIDCIDFANHIVLEKSNVSPNCVCSVYSRQSNTYKG